MLEVIRVAIETIISTPDKISLSRDDMWKILQRLEEKHDGMELRIDLSCGSVDMFCCGKCCERENSGYRYLNYDIREAAARIGLQ